MEYNSCLMIERFFMNINGRIDTGENVVTLCCEPIKNPPSIAFTGTAEEIVDRFRQERANVIKESKLLAINNEKGKRVFTAGCAKCVDYQKRKWNSDGLIHYVNLSMYPAPCQCKCIYCGVYKEKFDKADKKVTDAYEKLFQVLELVKKKGMLAEDVRWQISSGEITIHPYKERILELVGNQTVTFFTNCFKFDEGIARNLNKNPNSAINLSIDAGIPQTWYKVKGFNNFETITSNLAEYYANCCREGQITLKYIILPGVNDNLEDYLSVIEIMKILNVRHLSLARDVYKKYGSDEELEEKLIGATAYLVALCQKNGFTNDMFTYSSEERKCVMSFAESLLLNGIV